MPNPQARETESDYIARFMASGEAQRDFPDEKQRAAVAYSKFRERKNNMQLCGGCGCEMTMNPDAIVQDCASCGHRVLGLQTPVTEDLNNICPSCRHPLRPEHDDFGCNIPGCPCTMTGANTADRIQDVLPNSAKDKKDPEAKNASYSKFCRGCQDRLGGKSPEGLDGFVQDGVMHVGGNTRGTALCGVKAIENANADPSEDKWKDSSDYNADGGCKKCGWGAPGTGHSSGYHKDGCAILKKERQKFEHLQGAERRNARPDFEKTIAAFEAHCKSCSVCGPVRNAPAGSDQADAKNLCPTGAQLLVADLENEGMSKCAGCNKPLDAADVWDSYNTGKKWCKDCDATKAAAEAKTENTNADKKIVLEQIAQLEQEIAAYRAKPQSPENDKILQAKETTLAGLRRELGNGGSDICAACKKERSLHRDDGQDPPAGVCRDFKGSDSSPFVAMNSNAWVPSQVHEEAGAARYGSTRK